MTNPYSPNNFSLDSTPAPTAATQWNAAPKKSNTGLYIAAGAVAVVAIAATVSAVRSRKAADAAEALAAKTRILKDQAAAKLRAEAAFKEASTRTRELADMHVLAVEMEQGVAEMQKTRLAMQKTLEDLDHKMKVRARALEMLENGEIDPAKVK
jgi:hypothetical protein